MDLRSGVENRVVTGEAAKVSLSGREPRNVGKVEHRIHWYPSLAEFGRQSINMRNESLSSSRVEEENGDWFGTTTYEAAVALAEQGWDGARAQVDRLVDRLKVRIRDGVVERQAWRMDYVGQGINMGRYMAGDPRCRLRPVVDEGLGKNPSVAILISGTANSGANADLIMRRGAGVIALVDLLLAANRSCEVWLEMPIANKSPMGSGDGRKTFRVYSPLVCIKRTDEIMDINSMMFALAHPSMFRRLGFGAMEGLPKGETKDADNPKGVNWFGEMMVGGGYGYCVDPFCKDVVGRDGADVVLDSLFSGSSATFGTDESLTEWVIETLESCGVELEDV